MKNKFSTGETLLGIHLGELRLRFFKQYRFNPNREWTADFYLPEYNLLIECEGATGYFRNPKGGVTLGGRHTKQKGFEDDIIKYNTAQMQGFRLLRFSSKQIGDLVAKNFLKHWLCNPKET